MKRSRLLPALGLFAGALFWGCFSDKSVDPTSPDTIQELQLKGSLSGTVADSVGHGISGVAVTLDSGGFATNTDSLGRYTIPDVPGRIWTVRFTKTNWADTSLTGVVLAIDEDKKGLDMRMRAALDSTFTELYDTAGSFAGTVKDTAGKLLSNVSVLLVGGKGQSTVTDSVGGFVLTGVPAGSWAISFGRFGYADTAIAGLTIARKEKKTGIVATMRPVPVQIIDTTGSFAGVVMDTAQKPLSGVTVLVVGQTGLTTLSDSVGNFVIQRIPAGTWGVRFSKFGYDDTILEQEPLAAKEVRTGIVAKLRPIPVTIIDSTGSFRGIVTDTVSKALSGVSVLLESLDGKTAGLTTMTDSGGRFHLTKVPAGTWKLLFSRSADFFDTTSNTLVLARQQNCSGLVARLRPKPIILSDRQIIGTFTQPGGIGKITCIARSADGVTLAANDLTWDPNGSFSGLLPIGTGAGSLRVTIYDTAGRATGKMTTNYLASSASIFVPGFSARNAIPSIQVKDTLGIQGSALHIHATTTDDTIIARIEWSVNGSPFSLAGSDTLIQLPDRRDSTYQIIAKVTDLDENIAYDTATVDIDQFIADIRDGTSYRIARFGSTTWMAQSMSLKINDSWSYMNNQDSALKYGRYYTWAAAMMLPDSCNDSDKDCSSQISTPHQGICPTGWHIPSYPEARALAVVYAPNLFREMLAGFRGLDGTIVSLNKGGYYWNTYAPTISGNLTQGFSDGIMFGTAMTGRAGFSVRCLQN